jgi:hypothetical protein
MTLPLYLAVHLIYGTAMGFIFNRRMRAEGEVLGVPLVLALVPVAVITGPLGALLLRYAPGWFLHGHLIDQSVSFERFHLGMMLALLFFVHLVAAAGMIFAVAFLSRNATRMAVLPAVLVLPAALIGALLAPGGVFTVMGTGGKMLWQHPAGLVSLGILAALGLSLWLGRRRALTFQEQPS